MFRFHCSAENDSKTSVLRSWWQSKELSDPLWDKALQIENHPNYFNEPFVQAIQNKDAEKAYTLCLEKVNTNGLLRNNNDKD